MSRKLFGGSESGHISRTNQDDTSPVVTLRSHKERRLTGQGLRATEKAAGLALSALVFSTLGISGNIAHVGDDTLTKAIDTPAVENVETALSERATKEFVASLTHGIETAIESTLPRTMKVVRTNPDARKLYEDNIQASEKQGTEQAKKAEDINVGPHFFERMRDTLHHRYNAIRNNGLETVGALAMGVGLLADRLRWNKASKARVSQNFLNDHIRA